MGSGSRTWVLSHRLEHGILIASTVGFVILAAEGAENGVEFTIVRPFNWIGPRMDFIPGVDGPSDSVPRVLACFSNVRLVFLLPSSNNIHK